MRAMLLNVLHSLGFKEDEYPTSSRIPRPHQYTQYEDFVYYDMGGGRTMVVEFRGRDAISMNVEAPFEGDEDDDFYEDYEYEEDYVAEYFDEF